MDKNSLILKGRLNNFCLIKRTKILLKLVSVCKMNIKFCMKIWSGNFSTEGRNIAMFAKLGIFGRSTFRLRVGKFPSSTKTDIYQPFDRSTKGQNIYILYKDGNFRPFDRSTKGRNISILHKDGNSRSFDHKFFWKIIEKFNNFCPNL